MTCYHCHGNNATHQTWDGKCYHYGCAYGIWGWTVKLAVRPIELMPVKPEARGGQKVKG